MQSPIEDDITSGWPFWMTSYPVCYFERPHIRSAILDDLISDRPWLMARHWDSCLRWFMGEKNSQMFIQTKTSPRLEIIAGWGYLPISMVLRSERSLKSKMLSLARTSKYANDTSVFSIKKSEDDS